MNKQFIYDEIKELTPLCASTCRELWNHPEIGGNERESANLFRKILADEGFTITNSKIMEHAFYAEYGSGAPVIAVLGEYDALPGLSQKACTTKEPVVEGGPGHGCGHNLLGSAVLTAAIAIKRYLEQSHDAGTLRFYGCPQEELLDGKVRMAAEGMFEGCDAALSWHPMDANCTHDKAYIASAQVKFYFTGRASHAAFAPERGRSALDAVELMSVGVNYLREHVIDHTRIHYSTDGGGFAPNVVPDHASAWYYVRAPRISDVKDTMRRVELVAQGAATMTETQVRVEHGWGCCEMLENNAFGDLTYANMLEAEAPVYTPEELQFASEIQSSIDPAIIARMKGVYEQSESSIYMGPGPRDLWKASPINASSDVGDVSYLMPTTTFTTACWPLGTSPHTWQAAAANGTSIGEKGALYAAQIIAGTAYDLFTKPEELAKVTEEFKRRTDPAYEPMVGDDWAGVEM